MTTYYGVQKTCPACGENGFIMQCGSCNTFGATFFTDGYVDGPMFDPGVELMRCGACAAFCWWGEAETVESGEGLSAMDPGGAQYEAIRGDGWLAALEAGAWSTPEQERTVRQQAWWAANGRYRSDPAAAFVEEPQALDNARRLLTLIGDQDGDVVMRAELLRYLGDRKACIEQLDRIDDERFTEVVARIRALAREGRRGVASLGDPG